MAFNIFIGVYIQKHPDDIQGLLAYVSHVEAIMDEGPLNKGAADCNFYDIRWIKGLGTGIFYDIRFRQGREYTHCSWLLLRPNLEAKAYHGTGSTPFRDREIIPSSIPKGTASALISTRRAHGANVNSAPMIMDASNVVRSTQGTPSAMEKNKENASQWAQQQPLTLRLIFKVPSNHWVLTI